MEAFKVTQYDPYSQNFKGLDELEHGINKYTLNSY